MENTRGQGEWKLGLGHNTQLRNGCSVTTGRYEEEGALHLRKCWEPDIIVMRKVPETKETAAKHVAFEL